MSEGYPPITAIPHLKWDGSVRIETRTVLETGAEVQILFTWSEPVQPTECIISLRDSHRTILWSEKIAAGKIALDFQLPPTASIGTYTLDLTIGNWTLAEEKIELVDKGELARYEAFADAVSMRKHAASADAWEEAVRLDELAAEAYERSGADQLAAICFLDAAESALGHHAIERARAAAVRATKLAVNIGDMSVLARALLRLGEVEVHLDRWDSAMAALDRARTIAEVANIDLVAVKSSMLQWRCSQGLDHTRRLQYYRNLVPILTYAFTPAAQTEALTCIRELRPYLTLQSATKSGPRRWAAKCDFASRYLSQYADPWRVAEFVAPWDSSSDAFSNALLKRILTSLAKWLIGSSLDVVLAVEANRGESGESFKVTLRDPKNTRVSEATLAWSHSEDFTFLNELSSSAGGTIRTKPTGQSLVEFTLPNNI
jgi:hypothetical protein